VSSALTPAAVQAPARPCRSCGREWGAGISWQFCDQVEGLPPGVHLSSPARRFGGHLLEILLVVVTLGIGWIIWSLIIYGHGQTPAKQVLGMRVVELRRGRKESWGTMFVREWIAKPIIWVLAWFTLGIVYFWLIWDSRNQELWDKIVGSIVVNDPHRQLAQAPQPGQPAVSDVQDVRNWT
jgi:uncharacterized RDD family membrane protein YckC